MKKFSRPTHSVGLPPGTVAPPPESSGAAVTVRRIAYDQAAFDDRVCRDIDEALQPTPRGNTWLDIDGVHDKLVLERLGSHFDLHPLLLEDVANPVQRSKVEQYGDQTYIVVRVLELDRSSGDIGSRQISVILAGSTLITLHEQASDVFDNVRQRISNGRPRIRTLGVGYLAYSLLDAVVDSYFVLLEQIGEQVERLEEALLVGPDQVTLHAIHAMKRELIYLRKSVWPLREAISVMLRDEDLPFDDRTHVYLRDLHDHTVHVMETIESYRDIVAGMLETYLSVVSIRMNEVMKTLTVIATVFIPLTFIVGVYGMNFENMPELHWRWGYPAIWVLMVVCAALMLGYFWRRRWF